MTQLSIYSDIAQRTGGDIYMGVVGPVRTGKSTFIKRFFETMIVGRVPEDFVRERMIDELPQSSAGRTIMTTEPKFVPEKGISIALDENLSFRVRLIDCVGFIVPSSLGYIENEAPRMVKTPWFEEEIPFNMAAEIGTQKVIREHATIGLVITTDGSISEIPREEYEEAEERVINELKSIHKPFTVLLNCVAPASEGSINLANRLSEKYGVPVLPVDCLHMGEEDFQKILESVLYEFPMKKIIVELPSWIVGLEDDSPFKTQLYEGALLAGKQAVKLRDVESFTADISDMEEITSVSTNRLELGTGTAYVNAEVNQSVFYHMLSGITGLSIPDDFTLVQKLKEFALISQKYKRIEAALTEVENTGYGIVMPSIEELSLQEPEIVKQGNRYGVRLKASAPSIHMMRADIKTEVAPIVGSEKQSEDLIKYLLDGFEEDPSKIWQSNIFGKSLDDLVNEGLRAKLTHMPTEARIKLQQTLERVINEGCSGLICIII